MNRDPHIANIFSAEEEDCLSLEQMAAYQQGKLAGQDKHLVERHLLNCELCAMTYESLAENTPESLAAGAEEISDRAWERVQQQSQRKRRGAIFWIASAASVVLLVVVGYLTMKGPTDKQMARAFEKGFDATAPLHVPSTEGTIAMDNVKNGESAEELGEGSEPTLQQKDFAHNNVMESPKASPTRVLQPKELELDNMEFAKSNAGNGGVAAKDDIKSTPYYSPMSSPATGKTASKESGEIAGGKAPVAPQPSLISNSGTIAAADPTLYDDEMEDGDAFLKMEEKVNAESINNGAGDYAGGLAEAKKEVQATTLSGVSSRDQVSSVPMKNAKADANGPAKGGKAKTAPSMARSADMGVTESERQPKAIADKSFEDGIIAYKSGDYQDAAKDLRRATELTPSNLEAHIYAADAFLRISQPQAALYHIERVLAVPGNSHFEDAEWYKALAYLQLKEGSKAKKQLGAVIARGGKYKTQAEAALAELK